MNSIRNAEFRPLPGELWYIIDFIFILTGPWVSEKTPLLQRTNDQAKFFGAKTFINKGYFSSEVSSNRRKCTQPYLDKDLGEKIHSMS